MDLIIKKNGICKSITDFKVKKDGVVKNANYLYVKKDGERKLFWQRENGPYKAYKWLRLDGYCGIDTGITPQYGDELSAVMKIDCSNYSSDLKQTAIEYRDSVKNLYPLQIQMISNYIAVNVGMGDVGTGDSSYIITSFVKTGTDVIETSVIVSKTIEEQMASSTCTWKHDGVLLNPSYKKGKDYNSAFNGHYYIGNRYDYAYYCCIELRNIKISSHTYTPCQLIKELPASKAWDGKTHSAGECGMWDSVSDKFYGNANTSGSFTVSDED